MSASTGGAPEGLAGEQISPVARVLVLAQTFETHLRTVGGAATLAVVRARIGRQIDPEVGAAFLDAAEDILAALAAPSVWDPSWWPSRPRRASCRRRRWTRWPWPSDSTSI